MRKRYWGLAVWLFLACLLYFFENNTGTRIVLVCSLLLPFAPVLLPGLFDPDAVGGRPKAAPRAVRTIGLREEDALDDLRAYLPGDPVNRVHWKLSARRDELLVRARGGSQSEEEAEKEQAEPQAVPEAGHHAGGAKKRVSLMCLTVFLLSLLLLLLVPSANQGMKALLNRVFDASEAVNAYAYDRFDVPAGLPVGLSVLLLSLMGLSLLSLILLSGSRAPALGLMAGLVFFQVYFGLSFPAWVNVPLFALFALWMMKRPRERKTVVSVLVCFCVLSLAVTLLYPGVHAATEAASEAVRDRLSQAAQSLTGNTRELPMGENETRHVHSLSLTAGSREARPDREFRLVAVREEQISMPHWVDYLRIVLLLLLSAALLVLPFLPFILLNRRRKRVLDARKVFQSESVNEAVFAIFQHVAALLEATGRGGENQLYAAWRADLSPDYAVRFAACEKLFEEAAYSTHEMREEQRRQALALLEETEQILWRQAGWKQRLRLKYKECLWV